MHKIQLFLKFPKSKNKIESPKMVLTEFDEDVEIEQDSTKADPALLYATFSGEKSLPVFDETLGLAIEKLPENVTLQSLWTFK